MKIMANSASSICNSFFVSLVFIALYLVCNLFLIISWKANGHCEHFYNGELTLSTSCYHLFLNSVYLSYLMEVKSAIIKYVNFAKMS